MLTDVWSVCMSILYTNWCWSCVYVQCAYCIITDVWSVYMCVGLCVFGLYVCVYCIITDVCSVHMSLLYNAHWPHVHDYYITVHLCLPGEAYTAAQGYYERVNSHTATTALNYSLMGVRDVSRRLVELEQYPATRIYFTKGFSFATREAVCNANLISLLFKK